MSLEGIALDRRLAGIDLDVRRGEVLALVGPNGAGKSSLLGVLAGDLAPSRGRVMLYPPDRVEHDEVPSTHRPDAARSGNPVEAGAATAPRAGVDLRHVELATRARRRAVLGQHADAAIPLSVATVLGLAGVPWGAPGAPPLALVSAFELEPLMPRLCAALAGGERQRVQIARVCAQLWHVPEGVLLLDEPANHLDVRHQRVLITLLRERATFGQAVVLAVHDLTLALAVADRVAVFRAGRLLRVGAPADALDAATLKDAFGVPLVIGRTATGLRIDPFSDL